MARGVRGGMLQDAVVSALLMATEALVIYPRGGQTSPVKGQIRLSDAPWTM